MNKIFTKIFSGFLLTAVIMLGMGFAAFANESDEVDYVSTEEGIDLSRIQRLFPEIVLGGDGYVENYSNGRSLLNIASSDKFITETYSADYENGTCDLYIYSDGSYVAAGYEKVEVNQKLRAYDYGSTSTGNSYYKSYLSLGIPQISYTYKVTKISGSSYYQITNLGNLTYNGSIGIQFEGKGLTTVRSKQTSSSPAEVYGDVKINQVMSTSTGVTTLYNGTYRLTTKVSYGNISVSVSLYW